jgi:hypothetical protein
MSWLLSRGKLQPRLLVRMLLLLLAVCVSVSLKAKTLREIKENMGQCKSRKETLKNRKEERL